MSASVHVRKAEIYFQLPIRCSVCGIGGMSEPIRLEISHIAADRLDEVLRSQQLGTHFPVGWAQCHGVPRNTLKCPDCAENRGDAMALLSPQAEVDWALSVEQSVRDSERELYMECMNGIPMSTRVASPRPLDRVGRDVRDGCILTGVFCRCRDNGWP